MLNQVDPAVSVGFFAAFSVHVELDFEKHSAELAYDIPRALGSLDPITHHSGPPALPDWATSIVSSLFMRLPPHVRILAIHPETLEEKMWDLDKFVRVIDEFLDHHSEFFAFVLGVSDLSLDRGRHAARVIPCNGLPFYASAALVAKSDLFLGVDSCMLHVADIFRVPSVGLFGPTNPSEFGFRLTNVHRHVVGNGAMNSIEMSDVLAALEYVERQISEETASRRFRFMT
ncbi:glycosyltransferase family 9 protein [Rhizobium phaseoli]|uniref:glycosyltransferase family 9 protein n=1 Tax=Rhizobium phaseoli TaxID=396 RepID=UPI0016732B92|nr:glycosyltransferase family 9 protein [Rhizobium phaseoli]